MKKAEKKTSGFCLLMEHLMNDIYIWFAKGDFIVNEIYIDLIGWSRGLDEENKICATNQAILNDELNEHNDKEEQQEVYLNILLTTV